MTVGSNGRSYLYRARYLFVDPNSEHSFIHRPEGIFKQMGDVAVALTSLVSKEVVQRILETEPLYIKTIAVHTFSVLVLHLQSGLKTALLVISVIWIFIALVVGIGIAAHKGQIYYGNTQYWCWITTDYNAERIGLEYAWMWTAALVNIFCYMVIALVIKGVMIVDGGRIRFRRRSRPRDSVSSIFRQHPLRGEAKQANAIAMQMLFYPLIYLITVFPITLVRWLAFAGRSVPFSATAFAAILFSSSGLLNVTLFVLTRPGLLPGRGKSLTTTQNSYPLSTTLSPTSKPESPSFDFSNIRGTTSPRMTLAKLPALHVKGNSDVSQLYEGASV
ncbi:hypothetical protein VKT23_003279 [Stygiomarasmius scandens]|uniref:Glucose receptor Git3 N-terminal domain-containing protein n=1 Tax=Marasmiellus scandens TaxID=2682957 RepID=A0ABR1JY62_9AGAR